MVHTVYMGWWPIFAWALLVADLQCPSWESIENEK
jgi:hypothetical protein